MVALPASLTWGEYVGTWAEDRGGWTQLANELIDRAANTPEVSDDPQTIERGLRRLATRGHKSGGQYGRWMLRFFGFVAPVDELVKWMGQYHTRFADLPNGFRLEHLSLWNRPPIAESRLAGWIHVGIAHAHLGRLEHDACAHWLASAERLASRAGVAAAIECALLRAYLVVETGRPADARPHYAVVDELLTSSTLALADASIFRARLADQRARHFTRPAPKEVFDVAAAKAEYAAISEEPYQPFVSFRRCVGLAYCEWQLGNRAEATRLAHRAAEHAGDGGLLRMRVTALNMLSRVLEGDEAHAAHARAVRMAALLEDEELMSRVAQCIPVREA